MNTNNLKIQRFRTNDIVDDGGKQFELGRSWCEDFFGFPNSQQIVNVQLKFKPLNKSQENFSGKVISLELSGVTKRGDRKAYTNGKNNRSDIKNFFIDDLHLTVANNLNDYFAVYKSPTNEYYLYFIPELLYKNFICLFETIAPNVSVINENRDIEPEMETILAQPLQQIFYGAPGTGKSHTINEMTKGEDVIRTTFHPDTDYSSFVGAYKPATSLLPICNEIGEPMKIANQALYKEQIVYEFISQTFLQAYISAWKKYADTANGGPKKQFLVIEEINRGNCAQIFGDLFQLLDRNDYGFSEYPIKADADMKKQLKKVFKGLDIPQKDSINAMFEGRDVVTEVLDGDLLLLPNNLYIWATMNTSDQSLFPIDSAFKRRWDWTYIPISNANKGWTINTDDSHYDWWQFVERINDLIGRTTNSEDKKLGYFFCKAKDGEICAETFVGKVIFYLWNDVFKDYDFCDQVFNDANGNKLTFDKFYTAEGNNSKVVLENVELFLKNLKLEPVNDIVEQEEFVEQEADGHDLPINNQNKKDYTRYSINGEGNYPKKEVATELVKKYIGMNPGISADDVVENWKKLGISVSHFIETEAEYNARTDNDKRSNRIECNGSAVYVTWNGWGGTNRMKELKEAVSKQGWGLNIQEIMQ
jgi:hypothetical protein